MKKILLIAMLLPVFCAGQKFYDADFNRIKNPGKTMGDQIYGACKDSFAFKYHIHFDGKDGYAVAFFYPFSDQAICYFAGSKNEAIQLSKSFSLKKYFNSTSFEITLDRAIENKDMTDLYLISRIPFQFFNSIRKNNSGTMTTEYSFEELGLTLTFENSILTDYLKRL